ncbi:MAG: hypothetical protein SFW67_26925 [Myxococcaceae bacterium]|nr:hypothetical protein [Myxococcaceae bacterium]
MRRAGPWGLLVGLLAAATARAHPEGFHVRAVFTLTKTAVTGLVVMDVDGGERCELMRAGADTNRDGTLSDDEKRGLERRLVSLVLKPLKVGLSSYAVPLKVQEVKLNLRQDASVSRSAVSVALLLEANHPYEVSPGMHFEFETVTPDGSPVRLEVLQAADPSDGAPEPDFRRDVESGRRARVRLGLLARRSVQTVDGGR